VNEEQETQQRVDPTVGIFQIIRDAAILRFFFQHSPFTPHSTRTPLTLKLSGRQPAIVRIPDVLPRILGRGYRQSDIDACLTEYEELNVWKVGGEGQEVRFEQ
jgi:hypothetical protein